MCKDCSNSIYREISRPSSFNFKKDLDVFKQYYIPIGPTLSKRYFDNKDEMFLELDPYSFSIGNTYTDGVTVFPRRREHSWSDGLFRYFDDFETAEGFYAYVLGLPQSEYDTNANYLSFYTRNLNFDRYTDNHSAFLRHDYTNYRSWSSNKLQNPTWFINFNVCNGKEHPDSNFYITACGKNVVHSKLKIRPFLFLSGKYNLAAYTYVDKNIPFYIENDGLMVLSNIVDGLIIDEIYYNYEQFQAIHDLQLSIETQEGSKWFGAVPMRVEYGLHEIDNDVYYPIVWSDHNYPQIVAGYNHYYWEDTDEYKLKNPNITLQNTVLSPNVTSNVISYTTIYPGDEEGTYYYNYANVLTDGMFVSTNNNMNNPGYIIVDLHSQLEGIYQEGDVIQAEELLEEFQEYFIEYRDPVGNPNSMKLQVDYEYNINNEWVTIAGVEYKVANVAITESNISFGINSSSQIWVNEYESGYVTIPNDGAGPTSFFQADDTYLSRYKVSLVFERMSKFIPAWNRTNQKLKNYTDISNDFLIEIEGHFEFDFEKGKTYQMYLRVLPDTTNDIQLNLSNTVITPIRYGAVMPNLTTTNCNVNIVSLECGPWGELSVDSRTGYTRKENIQYEPLLPLHQRYINDSNKNLDEWALAADNFRYGYDINPQIPSLYLMIENGSIKIEGTCDCC